MKGLVVWANSYCRSTLAFYSKLADSWGVPLEIYLYNHDNYLRSSVGFSDKEFYYLNIRYLSCLNEGLAVINTRKTWNHLFGVYQVSGLYRDTILYAIKMHCRIAVASESPCNMDRALRRLAKSIYLRFILPRKVAKIVASSSFVINYSGNDIHGLLRNGWGISKIIRCGYYPPPLIDSVIRKRGESDWTNFEILVSGLHQWHRSPFLILRALRQLDLQGKKYKCFITQQGPLHDSLVQFANRYEMSSVFFLGYVDMKEMLRLYQRCSVFVGCGNHEPWGMRLNDALQCGAPLIVNRGMGGCKLVDDYGCGITFERNDVNGLVDALTRMIDNKKTYLSIANNAFFAGKAINPESKAEEIARLINNQFPDWI